jgi:outer membrane biosynthesis protein TonB
MSILRSDDFLITTWVGKTSRRVVWHGKEPLELDMPYGWILEKHKGKFRVRNTSVRPFSEQVKDSVEFDIPALGYRTLVELPAPNTKNNLNRPLDVEIIHMKPLDPVYLLRHQMAPNYPSMLPKQLMQFYGERYYLVRYRPVPPQRVTHVGGNPIFEYKKTQNGYSLVTYMPGLRLKTASEKILLPMNARIDMTEQAFFSATFIYGVHWWRFRMVPTPDSMPPVETEETEEDTREELRFKQSALTFLIFFMVLLGSVYKKSLNEKPAPKVVAEVEIKKPVVIPPTKEQLKPPPPPPPPPPEPPKVVELKEPEPPKPEPPKPQPKPKVAKKTPKPKKIAHKEPPAKAPEPPPKPAKVVNKEPPANTGNAAAQKAAETAAMKQQLLKKLGFLSTSSKRAVADPQSYDSPKEGRFTDTPVVGGDVSKSNSLDKIVKDAPGDGNIRTNSSRTVSSSVDFGKKHGKGLNDVQGKVSMGEFGSAKLGDSLGSSSGLSVSGSGDMDQGALEAALAKYIQRFQLCYEKALLSDPSLGGKVTMQWTVSTSGAGQNPKVMSSQLNNNDVHNCISKVLKEIPFPKPKGGTVVVKKVFAFSSSAL